MSGKWKSLPWSSFFEGRIDRFLAVIYRHMIYRDIIDAQVARVLPGILRANRICCQDASMKYVVVGSALLEGEDAYPLNDGTAYVPLYFDDCVLLFQDVYGNRYMDVPLYKGAGVGGTGAGGTVLLKCSRTTPC